MKELLKSYMRRLTDLSASNRSLLLKRLLKDQFIDIHEFNFVLGEPSFNIIAKVIGQAKDNFLCDELDARDVDNNKASQRLHRINRTEEFIFQERGAKDLYLGWPFIQGKFIDDTLVRCPLIFFPVSLEKLKGKWKISQKSGVNVTLNKSLLLAYSYFNETNLDEELVEKVLNDFDPESTQFRTQLYDLLKKSNLEINFNQEIFLDELKPFKDLSKSQLESSEKKGKLKLLPQAVLGIFPQAGSYLIPDYVQLLEDENSEDLEEFFARRVRTDPEDESHSKYSDRVREENTYTPFALDAFQERALKLVKKGNSINVQGPPGTGKSQLISNMICDFIARGKNVLVVCQKRAALDVVYDRLKEKEIHDFVGLVHDFKNDRRLIFNKIDDQINSVADYKQKNTSLDTIHLERSFVKASRNIEEIEEELESFRHALFDESESGKSAKELYLTTKPSDDLIHLNQVYSDFKYGEIDSFVGNLRRFLSYQEDFGKNTNHFWANERSFADYGTDVRLKIKKAVDECIGEFAKLQKEVVGIFQREMDFDELSIQLQQKESLSTFASEIISREVYDVFYHLVGSPPDEEGEWVAQMEKLIYSSYDESGMESTLESKNLGKFQEVLERALSVRNRPLRWIKWRIFSKDQVLISRVFEANNLKTNKEGFKTLVERVDNRLNFEHNISLLRSKGWLKEPPSSLKKKDWKNWFFYQRNGYKAYGRYRNLRGIKELIPIKEGEKSVQLKKFNELIRLVGKFDGLNVGWSIYLSSNQIRKLLLGQSDPKQVKGLIDKDYENLHDFDTLKRSFNASQNQVIDLIQELDGSIEYKIDCFQNSLGLAWIDHIEAKYPVLRSVLSRKFDLGIQKMKESMLEKQGLSQEILILKSRERTYQDLSFNRLHNQVTYRDLQHQVTKKKRIWPLRKVLSEYREEIFQLIPCWMVSPESASAIFPLEEVFDLVIFDEASQCFTERGIPSMYRGKQIVVAGDEHQLRPFDLYQVRWEDEDVEDPDFEVSSLLDLTNRYFQTESLDRHYRSESLELAAFSNEHFYQDRLQVLPDLRRLNKRDPALEYIKMEGIWDKNTNRIEAERVIELLTKLSQNEPKSTIGVVTFNATQQLLIQDLMDEKRASSGLNPKRLFIKNIENVQGDERDVIIFSTGYAKDKKGKLQARFGALNLPGGENRLNVAITRAKKKVYLVTSVFPSELKVESSKNIGPKLFRDYLDFVWKISQGKWKYPEESIPAARTNWYLKTKIKEAISSLGMNQKSGLKLPFADVTVADSSGSYQGVINTDDDFYYQSLSVKDIYLYREEDLTNKHWPQSRIYSREWWADRTRVEDRIRIFLNSVN